MKKKELKAIIRKLQAEINAQKPVSPTSNQSEINKLQFEIDELKSKNKKLRIYGDMVRAYFVEQHRLDLLPTSEGAIQDLHNQMIELQEIVAEADY